MTVSLTTQASPEVYNSIVPKLQLSAAFTSRRRLRQIKVPLSLSLTSFQYSSLYIPVPASIDAV